MSNDFCVDPFYELYASDFLSDEEIAELTTPRELSEEAASFWADLRMGVFAHD